MKLRSIQFLRAIAVPLVLMTMAIIGGGFFYKWVEIPILNTFAKYRSRKKMAAA
jgi:hypothetical protein